LQRFRNQISLNTCPRKVCINIEDLSRRDRRDVRDIQYGSTRARFKLFSRADDDFPGGSPLIKQSCFVVLVLALGSLASAQNKHAADPVQRPYHDNAVKPLTPARKTSGDLAAHPKPIGNVGMAPAKTGNANDAQVTALEHKQATIHYPKPAPKNAAPAAKAAKPADGNEPINFTYKTPNAKNTPVGGQANGRSAH
jgi:hypothetical protein